jgi:hypothetical protein
LCLSSSSRSCLVSYVELSVFRPYLFFRAFNDRAWFFFLELLDCSIFFLTVSMSSLWHLLPLLFLFYEPTRLVLLDLGIDSYLFWLTALSFFVGFFLSDEAVFSDTFVVFVSFWLVGEGTKAGKSDCFPLGETISSSSSLYSISLVFSFLLVDFLSSLVTSNPLMGTFKRYAG